MCEAHLPGTIKEKLDSRVEHYVSALPGTLLESNASETDLIAAGDIYRDGIMDGMELIKSELIDLCKLLPTHIDLDNLDPVDFKDNSHRLIPALKRAKQILECFDASQV